jgi:cell wall-associated NlpC family hydrolase
VATPHASLTHAREQLHTDRLAGSARGRRFGPLRSSLLIGATAALTLTALPGTASAVPGDAVTADQAAAKVAQASHELEVVSEELNEAKVVLAEQQDAVREASEASEAAEGRLDDLDGQIRQLARSAYTGTGTSQLDVLLTSDSVEDMVSSLGTLDAIAGHNSEVLGEVSLLAEEADESRKAADGAAAEAQRAIDGIAAQQRDLEAKIADYQRQYDALSAQEQAVVQASHGGGDTQAAPTGGGTQPAPAGGTQPAPTGGGTQAAPTGGGTQPAPSGAVAPSAAAQVAVDTALAQVGDAYVWGAGGPDAFDCSGLTSYAYAAAGISLPHSSKSQAQMGQSVPVSQLQPGDLLFYYQPTSHVAMYIGNGQMVHASTSSQPVKVVSFDVMRSEFTHAKRIVG